jgi:hypothetical protein
VYNKESHIYEIKQNIQKVYCDDESFYINIPKEISNQEFYIKGFCKSVKGE